MSVALVFVGVTLAGSGAAKMTSQVAFRAYLVELGASRQLAIPLGLGICAVEVVVGGLLLVDIGTPWVAFAAAVLTLGFVLIHVVGLRRGVGASCRCFGAVDTDMSPLVSLGRAVVLVAVVLPLAYAIWHGATPASGATDPYVVTTGLMSACTYVLISLLVNELVRKFRRDRAIRDFLTNMVKKRQPDA